MYLNVQQRERGRRVSTRSAFPSCRLDPSAYSLPSPFPVLLQLRLMTEEQKKAADQVQTLLTEKRQLSDTKKQLTEENRMLGVRVRTLTAKNKQLTEEKRQAIQQLELKQDEEKHKYEKRIKALESSRDEALQAAKTLEDEKARVEKEYRQVEESKRDLTDRISELQQKLQDSITERNRIQDALNNEKNLVEENKERHRIEMEESLRRVAEQQAHLKESFAVDYRRAGDEIERLTNEKEKIINLILDFSDMHGSSSGLESSGPGGGGPLSGPTTPTGSPRRKLSQTNDPTADSTNSTAAVAGATRRVANRIIHLEKTLRSLTERHKQTMEQKENLEREVANLEHQQRQTNEARRQISGQHARILQVKDFFFLTSGVTVRIHSSIRVMRVASRVEFHFLKKAINAPVSLSPSHLLRYEPSASR